MDGLGCGASPTPQQNRESQSKGPLHTVPHGDRILGKASPCPLARPLESSPVAELPPIQPSPVPQSRWARGVGLLRPSHAHSAFSATRSEEHTSELQSL